MGGSSSSLSELGSNPLLIQLSGPERVSATDTFWNDLLAFHQTQQYYDDASEARLVEEQSMELVHTMLRSSLHASTGGNVGSLMLVTQSKLTQVLTMAQQVGAGSSSSSSSGGHAQAALDLSLLMCGNALLILRSVFKMAMEHCNGLLASIGAQGTIQARDELFLKLFATPLTEKESAAAAESANAHDNKLALIHQQSRQHLHLLVGLLMEALVKIPVNNGTYRFHLELVNFLLIFLSSTLYHSADCHVMLMLDIVMRSNMAEAVVKKLLLNFTSDLPTPSNLIRHADKASILANATSYIASSLWSVVTLGYGSSSTTSSSTSSSSAKASHVHLLASQSVLLLLVLCNECSNGLQLASFSSSTSSTSVPVLAANPYRQAFIDSIFPAETVTPLLSSLIHFVEQQEAGVLLLYLLMHRNASFRSALHSSPDLGEQLTLAILPLIYASGGDNSHQIYMSLILLLMLTEHDSFTAQIHHKTLKRPPLWLVELSTQTSGEVSVGSVIVFVLVRTVLCHLNQLKDKYLHTNCLATLANMSARMANLHPLVCRRLTNLMRHLHRRHSRLEAKLRKSTAKEDSNDSHPEDALDHQEQVRLMDEISVLEDTTRMVLEIVNSILCHTIQANPHLVYSLMCQQEVCLLPFASHPSLQDVVNNIRAILGFFFQKLQSECPVAGDGRLDPTEQQVMQVIRSHSATVSRHQGFRRLPELKYKYVEENSPEEFFVPYVWSLVYQKSGIYFNATKVRLFQWASVDAAPAAATAEDPTTNETVHA